MTRPPNKRVSRGQPVRRGAPAKKSGGCAMALAAALAVTASGVLMLIGQWHMVPVAWLVFLHVSLASPPAQRHRPWLPPPAPGLTGAAVLRGAAAPGDSPQRRASSAAVAG